MDIRMDEWMNTRASIPWGMKQIDTSAQLLSFHSY